MKANNQKTSKESNAVANQVVQKKSGGKSLPSKTIQRKENNTGMPDQLKSGVENLSGMDMSDVKVHHNSAKPGQLNAHAYAQGTDIHVGAGQEKHLPHEAWHVVQQKQGRVQPTVQMKGSVNVNDDTGLEQEADTMGAKATQLKTDDTIQKKAASVTGSGIIQADNAMSNVLGMEEKKDSTAEDLGTAGGAVGFGGTISEQVNNKQHGEATLLNKAALHSDASKAQGVLGSAGATAGALGQVGGGLQDGAGAVNKLRSGVYSGNKLKGVRAAGRGLDRLAQTASAVTSSVQSISQAAGAFGNAGAAKLGLSMNAAGGAVPIAGAVTGGISMARGLWNTRLAHKRKGALDSHFNASRTDAMNGGQISAVNHLKEIQGTRRKRGMLNAATGAMGMTAGILAATGVGAPVAAVLAGGAAAIGIGNALYKAVRQARRDKADRYNKIVEGGGTDEEKAKSIKDAKIKEAEDAVAKGAASKYNPIAKFSAWRAEKKIAKLKDDDDYGKNKLAKYKAADKSRKDTLATTSGAGNWFKRKLTADIDKSTEKKQARQSNTADQILAMTGTNEEGGSDQEASLASLGLSKDSRDSSVREYLMTKGKKPSEVKEKTWDSLNAEEKKEVILMKMRK